MLYKNHLINLSLSEHKLVNKAVGIINKEEYLLYLNEIMVELAMNALGKKITSQAHNGKELTDRTYKGEKKPSNTDLSHKTFEQSSDDKGDNQSSLKEVKRCPSCGAGSPAEHKYCIQCGMEI